MSESQPLGILQGVRVLSFTSFLFGPYAVQYLADLGADVIKIEPPAGAWERNWAGGETYLNGVSAFYLLAHRNVRSVCIDLKHPSANGLVRELLEDADVLVENFRPGVMARLGLDYDSLHADFPGLVYASGTGYGGDGPRRDLPGQDLLLQAFSGLASITGRVEDGPVPAGAAVVDQHAATLLAMSVLAALFHKERTGFGQMVEVNMVQAALDLQAEPVTYWLNGCEMEKPVERLGSAFHAAPYGIYSVADGHLAISLSPMSLLREALGHPVDLENVEDEGGPYANRDAIHRVITKLLQDRLLDDTVEQLRSVGVWCQPVNDYERAFSDPIVKHLDPVLHVEHPVAGEFKTLKHPVRYSSGVATASSIGPTVGESTDQVLAEIGLAPEVIQDLRSSGCIA